MTTNIFYDTEFLDNGRTIELISIGLWTDGQCYYAVNSDVDFDRVLRHGWLWENVVPHLPTTLPSSDIIQGDEYFRRKVTRLDRLAACVKPKWVIANEVRDFIVNQIDPQLWAYYAAYDHVALAQLWGSMANLPKGIPMWTNDLMQESVRLGLPDELKPQTTYSEHSALADAQWNAVLFEALRKFERQK